MCGCARFSTDVSEIERIFGIPPERPTPNLALELEPGADRYAAGRALRCRGPAAQPRRHALGPDPVLGQGHQDRFSTFNARGEEIDTKPAFRAAFRQRRCLVPLDTCYEWQKTAKGKQPYAVGLKGGGLMAMAGLRESWNSPAGERVRSFTIITTAPNELCAQLHNRMPAILKPAAWPAWLGEEPAELPQIKALFGPYAAEDIVCWPASARVGNVRNNDPGLVEPAVLR